MRLSQSLSPSEFKCIILNGMHPILTYLLAHPDATYIIGQNGRDRAMDLFHIDHYLEKWEQTIAETLTNKLNV